ncbi:HTTM domain-containing protein [Algoriphagus litoralis]|uniref:HTTM domain-containing protein n=1 Tax=Algoriphagus litoralis TaxID=2202829 RepID=UPI001300B7FD|nr:HTTM domain-containing protein [Algoriphagus litoralis]
MDWIFRIQIALLYLGAGFNKLFDPDWISGQYFDFFFSEPYRNSLYLTLSSLIPERGLVLFFSYSSIVAELGLGAWALLKKRRILLVLLINFFHISMLFLTLGELSYIFYFLMAVSSYLLLPWEEMKGMVIPYSQESQYFSFVKFWDFDRFFNWKVFDRQIFVFDNKKNSLSLQLISILFSKYLYGFLILILVFICRYKHNLLALF